MLMAVGLCILIISAVLYLALVAIVLPSRMLKVVYPVKEPSDRGIKKCLYYGKPCMVYTSSSENKPYISQYLLIGEDDYKTLRCKVTPSVEYLDYDIVYFDRFNKPLGVINVKEEISSSDLTKSVILPKEASYVRIIIRRVNRKRMRKGAAVRVGFFSVLWYSLAVTLMTALEAFAVRAACSYSFGDVYRESFIASSSGLILIAVLAVCTGIISILLTLWGARRRARK